jgi:hypothetical protein
MEETAFDPRRRLCPDGACVGVLDAEGRCSVCQRRGEGSGMSDDPAAADDAPADDQEPVAAAGGFDPASGFDPSRRLCDDGSCVGIVGADGACGTCGRRAD